jgi:hypothetical protein
MELQLALLQRTWRAGLFVSTLVLGILASGCGGGSSTPPPPPPPPKLSIVTTSLLNGMVAFPYSQVIQANGGVAPFVWSVSSGSLPDSVSLTQSSKDSITISGTPASTQTATFTIQVKDASSQTSTQAYTVNIANTGSVQMQALSGQVSAGVVEIQGASAASFNPMSWQHDTLNWVPDVRTPMLAPLPGTFQNIYSPWALEQANGWLLFYGGWDGTETSDDRVYNIPTQDFLTFGSRTLVIDHGAFLHVNNENITQLPDGSMHMITTTTVDAVSNDKPTYFSSPDGITWNGAAEPYSAQLTDVVSIPDDPIYAGSDYNGGNVLLWDNNEWTLYYSEGVFGGPNGKVFRATSLNPPQFQSAGSVLNTSHYANDVRKLEVGGKTWYLMLLYIEEVTFGDTPSPVFSYSLSNDGITFGTENMLFGGTHPEDHFVTTPAFVMKGDRILGVLYGANAIDLLNAQNQIYARWLQKKIVITDSSGTEYLLQGGYGPDRQWFQTPASGSLEGTMVVYAEDGVTPLAKGLVNLSGGKTYQMIIAGGS